MRRQAQRRRGRLRMRIRVWRSGWRWRHAELTCRCGETYRFEWWAKGGGTAQEQLGTYLSHVYVPCRLCERALRCERASGIDGSPAWIDSMAMWGS